MEEQICTVDKVVVDEINGNILSFQGIDLALEFEKITR